MVAGQSCIASPSAFLLHHTHNYPITNLPCAGRCDDGAGRGVWHLASRGLLAVNISADYFNLTPVLRGIAHILLADAPRWYGRRATA